jgi:hypothetical protein
MPKAISKSTTHTRRAKADDALLDMIRQHRELYDEYDRIEDRDDPRTDELLAKGILPFDRRVKLHSNPSCLMPDDGGYGGVAARHP